MRVKARGEGDSQQIYITLVEADGTSWAKKLTLSSEWQEIVVPINRFKISRGIKLPLGFPERWNYWLTPARGRGDPEDHLRLDRVEHLQISFRPTASAPKPDTDARADIASVALVQ